MTVRSGGLVVAALVLAGCGGHADARVSRTTPPPPPSPPGVVKARTCKPGLHRLGSTRVAYVAVVQRPTRAYRRPGRAAFARFGLKNVNGVETVFGVTGVVRARSCRTAWYHVQLPMRPNGAAGYVRARDLWVTRVPTRIEVDVSARRLSFFRRGRLVLRARIAVGSGATPTPSVAIHGTNEPWSIGHAVSNGCIRLPNAVLRRLFRATPAGTPVVVHP
jgi:hypothetical protein